MKAPTVISFTTPIPQFGFKASHWQKTGEAAVGSFSSVTNTAVKQIQLDMLMQHSTYQTTEIVKPLSLVLVKVSK